MHAPDDDDDEDSDKDSVDGDKAAGMKFRSTSGDDLGDSFLLDEQSGNKKGWVDDILDNKDEEGDDDDDEGDDDEDEEGDDDDDGDKDDDEDDSGDSEKEEFGKMLVKDWEQSDEDEPVTGALERKDVNEKGKKTNSKTGEPIPQNDKGGTAEGLPFVIAAPTNLQELRALLDNRSETEVAEAINRIRACNSIRLDQENRRKMQANFFLFPSLFN